MVKEAGMLRQVQKMFLPTSVLSDRFTDPGRENVSDSVQLADCGTKCIRLILSLYRESRRRIRA